MHFGKVVGDPSNFEMNLKATILFLFLSLSAHSQVIVNDVLSIDNADIVFNPEFIKRYKIKSIKGRISTKKPKQAIRKTNLHCAYFFDTLGRITRSYEAKNYYDTLYRSYYYNDKGRLIYQSVEDNNFLRYESYLWDNQGRITAVEVFERRNDRMGIPYTKSVKNESYTFQPCDSTCTKIISNSKGTPFMKEISFTGEKGNLVQKDYRYIATNEGTIEYFTYDKEGNMLSSELVTSKQKLKKEKYVFAYDDFGNLKEKRYYKAGVLQEESQYVVNENTGYLSALIEQDPFTDYLRIIQFSSYTYFD